MSNSLETVSVSSSLSSSSSETNNSNDPLKKPQSENEEREQQENEQVEEEEEELPNSASEEMTTPQQQRQRQQQQQQNQNSLSAVTHLHTDSEKEKLKSFRIWTPGFVLGLLILVHIFIYADRGVLSPAIVKIRSDRQIALSNGNQTLTQAQSGMLFSAFVFTFIFFSPVAVMSQAYFTSKTIILVGMLGFVCSVFLAGISTSFEMLLLARGLSGCGEALCLTFSVCVVDSVAPKEQKGIWLAGLYSTISAATAVGIGLGSVFVDNLGWRETFLLEAIPMIILVVVMWFLPNDYNVKRSDRPLSSTTTEKDQPTPLDYVVSAQFLISDFRYLKATFGAAFYTQVLSSLSTYAIEMLVQSNFGVTIEKASLALGGTIAVCGIVSSLGGGYLLDKVMKGPKLANAAYICAVSVSASIPFGYAMLLSGSFLLFVFFLVPTMTCLFAMMSPFSVLLMQLPRLASSSSASSVVVERNESASTGEVISSQEKEQEHEGEQGEEGSRATEEDSHQQQQQQQQQQMTEKEKKRKRLLASIDLRAASTALNSLLIHLLDPFLVPLVGKFADLFSGRCGNFDDSRSQCIANTPFDSASSSSSSSSETVFCKFIEANSPGEKSSCVSPDELFKAMRIAWLFLLVAIALWFSLYKDLKKVRA